MSKGWDSSTEKKLKTLAAKGLSTSEIGKRLGMSKNAIVGKLNRMKLNAKSVADTAKRVFGVAKKTAATPSKKASTPSKAKVKPVAKTSKVTVAPVKKKVTSVKGNTLSKTTRSGKSTTASVPPVSKSKPAKKASATPRRTTANIDTTITKTVKSQSVEKPVLEKKPDVDVTPAAARASRYKSMAMHQRIIQHSLEMAALKADQCRWPIGDPDSQEFHFCGEKVHPGKPYCYAHCRMAYQFVPPKKK